MAAVLDDLKSQVLTLSRAERNELIRVLIASVDGDAQDSPDAIAKAWDEEIARRISDADAGLGESIPAEEVFAKVSAKLKRAGA